MSLGDLPQDQLVKLFSVADTRYEFGAGVLGFSS